MNGAPTDFLFGFEELPASGSLVLIAAGEKDVMTLAAHGYAAITLASETAILSANVVRRLSRFARILICYDLDETGRTQAAHWAQKHQLGWVELPAGLATFGGKDVSDLFRAIKQGQLSPDAFEQALLHPHLPVPPRDAPVLANRPDRLKSLTHLSELLSMQGQLRTRTEGEIVFNPALFWHDDEPVIWPRTINMIQGQYGVHKSRLAELFATILLAVGPPTFDTLGLSFQPLAGETYKLCYVDTERNTSDQFPYALQSIKERAGFARGVHPSSFEYTSLINVPRGERFAALRDFLVHIRASFTGHIFTVLDVVPDCVRNFNDVNDSLELVDLLNEVINEQNITFLVLIHENPGGVKARGHLGTELGNKASTILQIAYLKSDDAPRRIIELSYLKRRYGTPDFTSYAEYDAETKGLIRAEPTARELAQKQRPQKAPLDDVLSLLPELLREPMPAGELEKRLGERLNVSPRTIHDRLKDCLPDGASGLLNLEGRLCSLTKQERGKEKYYALQPTVSAG